VHGHLIDKSCGICHKPMLNQD